ncbi:MAG TPA: phosphoribosyltransferase [Chloroflexi bacterium]|nr:phosphoribosyltransferase [Chloroflexota bacterium]
MYFRDRYEAGKLLAKELVDLKGKEDTLVLGIPRGGVVVAYEVAKALGLPLDVFIARKIGAPGNPELAIGAIASDGTLVLDEHTIRVLGIPDEYVKKEAERQKREIQRRMKMYRGGREGYGITGKTVILVDDGVATGATTIAALRAIRANKPSQTILAVPVAPPEAIAKLKQEADRVVCLHTPSPFWAVGAFYLNFEQTSDEEVKRLLRELAPSEGD